ncbi:EamA-like transporter family protein (plasmid) [Erwinia sp. E602]|uniref:DMT family transporter n=1 Tax=Erwinia sp. E602 TaxID=2675378 RepID=UPI001BAD56D2|nr:DMT family transporter [Erwinia sp. E602]QUG73564.1 EamA-like transporter family protein [Erwinia sp. E602]
MLSKTLFLTFLPVTIALLAGALLPFQASSNAAVGKALGHPLWGALVSLAVSALVLLPLLWLFKVPAPRVATALQAPWWIWIGGLFGALYVVSATAFAPKLGAGSFLVLVVAGQMIAAVLVDHFGLMNLTPRPINLVRVAGVALILAGAFCIHYGGLSSAGRSAPVADQRTLPKTFTENSARPPSSD